MRWILSTILILILAPLSASASTVDLGIAASSISFSKETLVAGDQVRIYAQISNQGDVDVSGYVSFFQASVPIGDSQVVSVRAGGQKDEVYVDFIVPTSEFNIRAEIRGSDPLDTNSDNDVALTGLFTPIFDNDLDGVANENDNCPDDSNADQSDSDADGVGDVCDSVPVVDVGDGGDEGSEGDEGGDSEAETVIEEVVQDIVDELTEGQSAVSDQAGTEVLDQEELATTSDQIPSRRSLHVSPEAAFTYEQTDWNTYRFQAQAPQQGYTFEWDFGDGTISSSADVEHVFRKYGEFTVTLRMTDKSGQVTHDSADVQISFFDLQNRMVQTLIGILVVLMLLALSAGLRAGRKKES
jgi:hypothetical protein